MFKFLGHLAIVVLLTLLTQLGGIAWLGALLFRRRLVPFVLLYAGLSLSATWAAPQFGRVALSCWEDSSLQVQSWLYCAMNRNYVSPELAEVLQDTAAAVDADYPGTVTQVLDANFPFVAGFPLLPHLSHHDGRKADLAFFYADASGFRPKATRSPIGYFAFEQGPSECPGAWFTLRWDLQVLQPMWRELYIDTDRTRRLLQVLMADGRVEKVFLEPHLQERLGLRSSKLRFQGCRAARHDDHIHLQLSIG
ncbi:membrane protein [Leisingera sp. ANG-S5]|nr:membrane protein [Leisingera sp. ANG-S5]